MSLLLAIETTVGPFSLALFKNKALVDSYYHQQPHYQAEQLIPSIGSLLTTNGYGYSYINTIAVSIGPGSFTGIRIGLAAAQGLSLAIGCPIIGIETLEAIAITGKSADYVVALSAGRDQFYSQSFSNINGLITAINDPQLISTANAMELAKSNIVIANTHDSYPQLSAHNVGLRALTKIEQGEQFVNPSPLYIRDVDAKLPVRAFA